MIDYGKILSEHPNGVLATQDGDKVRTRVMQFLFKEDDDVYFGTTCGKPVYAQLMNNPEAYYFTFVPAHGSVLAINGRAVVSEDNLLRKRALDENPNLRRIYGGPENPFFRLLCFDVKKVETLA